MHCLLIVINMSVVRCDDEAELVHQLALIQGELGLEISPVG